MDSFSFSFFCYSVLLIIGLFQIIPRTECFHEGATVEFDNSASGEEKSEQQWVPFASVRNTTRSDPADVLYNDKADNTLSKRSSKFFLTQAIESGKGPSVKGVCPSSNCLFYATCAGVVYINIEKFTGPQPTSVPTPMGGLVDGENKTPKPTTISPTTLIPTMVVTIPSNIYKTLAPLTTPDDSNASCLICVTDGKAALQDLPCSKAPTAGPSVAPTYVPTTNVPSIIPTYKPTYTPSIVPTYPTWKPSYRPSMLPSSQHRTSHRVNHLLNQVSNLPLSHQPHLLNLRTSRQGSQLLNLQNSHRVSHLVNQVFNLPLNHRPNHPNSHTVAHQLSHQLNLSVDHQGSRLLNLQNNHRVSHLLNQVANLQTSHHSIPPNSLTVAQNLNLHFNLSVDHLSNRLLNLQKSHRISNQYNQVPNFPLSQHLKLLLLPWNPARCQQRYRRQSRVARRR